jgi:hypothetical protein
MEGLRDSSRRRRAAAVAGMALTAVVLGLVLVQGGGGQQVVAGAVDGLGAPTHVMAPDPQATTTAAGAEPTTSTSSAALRPSSTTATTGRSNPSSTTSTTARPAPTTTTGPSSFGPLGPETVSFPYTPGQSSWVGTSNGITVRLRMEPAAPVAGQTVTFHLEGESLSLSCCGFHLLYGDGGGSSWKVEWPAGTCRAPGQGSSTVDYSHVYNKAGRWEFLYQVIGSCGGGGPQAALHGSFDVAAGGPARSQGPALPTITVSRTGDPGGDPTLFQVWAQAEDVDGYIARFVVDWGDGSSVETRPGDPAGCTVTPSGWPARSTTWLQQPYPSHRYLDSVRHTITVSAVSSGCDGRDEESVSGTLQYGT